jgi:hypothetical protein
LHNAALLQPPTTTPDLWGFSFCRVALLQHNMGRILDVGNNQKPLRRGGVWVIALKHLQRSDRLNNACAIGICLQDCKWLKFA